ncbi:MAG: c-type cytochrome biogenesis protein CcsB [Desulfobacterales bacterium]|nr:MAG: c-type cytochrome biogenesis protein CcsB [Desulfobacterales bacterium]
MKSLMIITILFYMLSTAGYFAYLFIQKSFLQRGGYLLLLGGFLCHTMTIGCGFLQSGHLPVNNLHDTLSLAGWAVPGVFLGVQYRFNLKILGVYAAPFVALVMVLVFQIPKASAPANDILKSFWLISHVTVIFLGEAAFALAAGVGVLYLLQERTIKTKKHRFFFKRLPSLELLDSTGYGCIVIGFSLLTLGLITGFVYAKSVWGRFWSWDPKEVWSGITWLFYAALLHERLTVGWRGRKSAIMAIIGFGVLLFTFLGVNLLLEGHHVEFTKF